MGQTEAASQQVCHWEPPVSCWCRGSPFEPLERTGVRALASWQDSARYALVLMFVFTATAHFNKMKHDLARMIPAYFPRPL